ncbi:hypothetical protein M5K25_016505 [Dendrobium thyrsiflorum]|uniref:Pectinesterase inhibitor domain-containing protein n=1 Tax=Dendrobium thyrsiflorum TaxID=117978 RepID=A0ABD0URP1_DENTH
MAPRISASAITLLIILASSPATEEARLHSYETAGFISTSKVQSNTKQLAKAAVSVSLAHAKSALAAVSSLAESAIALKQGETVVLSDCGTMLGDSVQKLQKSENELGGRATDREDANERVQNALTWVSTALTDENMCADELGRVDLAGKRDTVRGRVVKAAKHTSNALALVSNLASSIGKSP